MRAASAVMLGESFFQLAVIRLGLCTVGYFYYRRRETVEGFVFGLEDSTQKCRER